ncbi:MAG: recombinase family protein [Oscillospiraceae bacterium]|nr:recombinase family protein [Oscillospiraceae bacterium]
MKAVIYVRYSSDNQREESIEGQIRECTAFAEKNGITVLKHYIDRAYSAKTDSRPEFQRMINDSRQRLFDIVLVWKLDRFARNHYDSANYKNILRKNDVRVVSANEPISDRSEGILLESMLEGFAEYFSADLAEKVSPGMTENALKCKFNGGNPTIGFTSNKEQNILIDPVKAPFVLDAFKLYDDKLVIIFNHKDGAETIILEDIETALAEAGFGSDLVSFSVLLEKQRKCPVCKAFSLFFILFSSYTVFTKPHKKA